MPTSTAPRFLSVKQVSERLGVSRATTTRLISERSIPTVEWRGRVRVPSGALDRWLAEQDQIAIQRVAISP
jgi:excisionase family DNA binding protein